MKKQILTSISFAGLILFIILIQAGCEKKTEQPKEENKTEEITPDTSSKISPPVVEEKISIPDIKGTWAGKFDNHATTLTITSQTDSSFSGKISISYRQAINQEVKGSFSPSTMKMTMTDQLHSRYEGGYDGKLSADLKNFSGTFTMKLDGSKLSFNLNKK
jgi:PBP1b-binding outer membrane lipoprotein LpoB